MKKYTTPATHVAENNISFVPKYEPFYLYLDIDQRLMVQYEKADTWYAIAVGRMEHLAEQGIESTELDDESFTKDFINMFCQNLNMRQMRLLADALQNECDAWDRRKKNPSVG